MSSPDVITRCHMGKITSGKNDISFLPDVILPIYPPWTQKWHYEIMKKDDIWGQNEHSGTIFVPSGSKNILSTDISVSEN